MNNSGEMESNFYDMLPDELNMAEKDGFNEIGSMLSTFSGYSSPSSAATCTLLNPPSSTASSINNDFFIDDVNSGALNLDDFILNDWGQSSNSQNNLPQTTTALTNNETNSNNIFYLSSNNQMMNGNSLISSPVFSTSDNDSDSGLGSESPKQLEPTSSIIELEENCNNLNSGLVQHISLLNNDGNLFDASTANNNNDNQVMFLDSRFDQSQLGKFKLQWFLKIFFYFKKSYIMILM